MFFRTVQSPSAPAASEGDFGYLPADACYLDAACQTLRPRCVIDAERAYYTEYNACGGRVKYAWGQTVDAKVRGARKDLLAWAGKSERDYCVAFTLNTTYGINLVLHQLSPSLIDGVVTSDIEHNSVLLPAMAWAGRTGKPCTVLPREADGSVRYEQQHLRRAVVLLSCLSNIDGRTCPNLRDVAAHAHAQGGLLLVDAAQGFGHDIQSLRDVDFDAAFGSGHKMYGPSIGFIVLKRSLLGKLEPFFLGGGTVTDVRDDGYDLLREGEEAHAVLEPGLQHWSGILGLGEAVRWLATQDAARTREAAMAQQLFAGLQDMDRVHLLNATPSSIVSMHVDGLDAHQLAIYLSQAQVMCRSGHFCCHRYLQHQRKLPPLLRVSLGLYNTEAHVAHFLGSLRTILATL